MDYADKTLECVDCGSSFTFTASEQEFFADKGFTNEPKRCLRCRHERKEQRGRQSYGYQRSRQMFPAVCAECGVDTEVPFEPREGRPVYCSNCYSKQRGD